MLLIVELLFGGRGPIDFLLEFTNTSSSSLQGVYSVKGRVSFAPKPDDLLYREGLAIIICSGLVGVVNRSKEWV